MIKKLLLGASLVLGLLGLMACSLVSTEKSAAGTHPQALGAGRPICTDCHEDGPMKASYRLYSSLSHTPVFVKDHKFAANQDLTSCATCHSQSSCNDCHAGKGVLSPAIKLAERPDQASPHRGGYLALHRVEGKTDPTSCFQCHGRANNQSCTACHK